MNPFLTAILVEVLGKVALRYLFKGDSEGLAAAEGERDQALADLEEAKVTAEALLSELQDVMSERDNLSRELGNLKKRNHLDYLTLRDTHAVYEKFTEALYGVGNGTARHG